MKKNKLIYLIAAAVAIIYHLSPVDFIPDVIPVVSQFDDVLAALIPLFMGYKSIDKESK